MSSVAIGTWLTLGFFFGSWTYVFRFRGTKRFENLSEYLRKAWPIFAPLNCLLYLFTEKRARGAIVDLNGFPELAPITNNWQMIREEAEKLYKMGYFEKTSSLGTDAYYDIGFRTFYKYGWSKFYLTWYGYTHNSAQKLMPNTVKLLESIPAVNGAMLTLLPVGSKLTRHLDPVACSLRYHLGLMTPNDDRCYINIDGNVHSWRDGKALLFDETYLHFAHNDSEQPRLILMCDIERPLVAPGGVINWAYKQLTKLTVVPNLEGDKRGLANRIFSGISPILAKTKALKQTNRPAYLFVKYTVNLTIGVILLAAIYGIFKVLSQFASALA